MPRRFQFSLKWLFLATLMVACFFGGVFFSREEISGLRNALKRERDANAKLNKEILGAMKDLALVQEQLLSYESEDYMKVDAP